MYEYKKINVSTEPLPNIEAAANRWAAMGWRTVAVLPSRGPGFADVLLVERERNAWVQLPSQREKKDDVE